MQKIKEQILTMLIEHCRIISSVISDMGVSYSSWAKNSKSSKDELEKKIREIEKKGKVQSA